MKTVSTENEGRQARMNELTNRQVLTFDPFKANADEADREFKALEACLLGIASSAQDMIKKGGER